MRVIEARFGAVSVIIWVGRESKGWLPMSHLHQK